VGRQLRPVTKYGAVGWQYHSAQVTGGCRIGLSSAVTNAESGQPSTQVAQAKAFCGLAFLQPQPTHSAVVTGHPLQLLTRSNTQPKAPAPEARRIDNTGWLPLYALLRCQCTSNDVTTPVTNSSPLQQQVFGGIRVLSVRRGPFWFISLLADKAGKSIVRRS
jgi:hypothetical protein